MLSMSRNCKASTLFYPDSILYETQDSVLKHSKKSRGYKEAGKKISSMSRNCKAPALAQVSRPGQERYLLFVFYVDTIYQNPQSHQPKFIADFNFPIVILFKFRQTTSNGRAQVMRP